jgi:hypothetical protein
MTAPENVEQFLVRYSCRVKIYLNRLAVRAQVIIGGIIDVAPRVADASPGDTLDAPEPGVRLPESARAKVAVSIYPVARRQSG